MNAEFQLCKTCTALKLDRDKFIIQKGPPLRRPIPHARTVISGSSGPISVRSGDRDVKLGTLIEIEARQGACPLCWLIVKSVTGRSSKSLSNNDISEESRASATCSVKWEIDGRAAFKGDQSDTSNKTRRIRICWDKPDFKSYESYLVLVADGGKNLPNSDMHSMWKDNVQYLGRNINSSHGKQSLAVSWMRLCNDRHGYRCNGSGPADIIDRFYEMLRQSYFGVIDVTNLQLTRLPLVQDDSGSHVGWAPYAALSYMWGDVDSNLYQTKRSNILIYKSHGGLEQVFTEFPKTIQDAIRLVRQLGIQYIWIDSLCIVQDSPRSWKLNSQNMDLIYGNSALTICAADGNNAEAGLRAMESQEKNRQYSRECAPGVTLMLSWPPESRIQASRWNQRAWTFQERLLSPRCLIFVDGRIYWQCRSTSMSEDIFRDGQGASWSLDSIQAPLQLLGDLKKRTFWFYMKCLPLYTSRHLTFQGDILAAFNGVSRLMERYLKAPFVFGIPTSHLDFALLWQPKSSPQRRRLEGAEAKWKDLEFPSWSWCGWKDTQVSYEPATTEGCLDDMHSWLMNHTWICWHIRDGHGNLRPLWDKGISKECSCAQFKWRGYRGLRDLDASSEPEHSIVGSVTPTQPYVGDRGQAEAAQLQQHLDVIGEWPSPQQRRGQYRIPERETHPSGAVPPPPAWPGMAPAPLPPPPPIMERPPAPVPGHRPAPVMRPPQPYPPPQMAPPLSPGDFASPRLTDYEAKEDTINGVGPNRSSTSANSGETYTRRKAKAAHKFGRHVSLENRRQVRYNINHQFDDLAENDLFDDWGRAFWPELEGKRWNEFSLTTPENPYSVLLSEFSLDSEPNLPDMPVLQFWTWKTSLQVRYNEDSCTEVGQGLCKVDIVDFAGDWCGSIVVSHEWINDPANRLVGDFIALSEAKKFTETECPVWTYYIPKERDESEWDVFYVLLIKYSAETNAHERVALGKVFKAAFEGCDWTEIILG